jgi:hypothetical protein
MKDKNLLKKWRDNRRHCRVEDKIKANFIRIAMEVRVMILLQLALICQEAVENRIILIQTQIVKFLQIQIFRRTMILFNPNIKLALQMLVIFQILDLAGFACFRILVAPL